VQIFIAWLGLTPNPMSTFKVLLDKRRQLKDETYPLILRVYSGRGRREINLKTYLKEKDFDDSTQKVVGKHPNKKLINQKIQNAILQVQQTTFNLEIADEVITSEKIKNLVVKPQSKLDFIEFGWLKVEELKAQGKYGNSCFYSAGISTLKKYSGKTYLAFKEINYTFLKQLEGKMLAKGVKVNTVALTFRTISRRMYALYLN
jgi:integrase/recombinase XerD